MTRRGPVRSLAGIAAASALAAALLAGCSLLTPLTGAQEVRDPSGVPTVADEEADVFTIKVGDCLNDASAADTVTTIPLVPCSDPHDSEVISSVQVDSALTDYDQDAVTAQAEADCQAAFESFAGIGYADSVLNFSYYSPTQESWDGGDREILCTIYDPDAQVTGTLAGSAR